MDRDIVIQLHPNTPIATEANIRTPVDVSPVDVFNVSPVGSHYTISPTRSPSRSRHSTPVDPIVVSPARTQRTRHVETGFPVFTGTSSVRRMSGTDDRAPPPSRNIEGIEKMLVKQGKQIRALYELQKSTFDRISTIQNQMKKLTSKAVELSPKVFSVSNHNLV